MGHRVKRDERDERSGETEIRDQRTEDGRQRAEDRVDLTQIDYLTI